MRTAFHDISQTGCPPCSAAVRRIAGRAVRTRRARRSERGDGLAVGLALGGLHHLADEEPGELAPGLVVAVDEAGPLVGVAGDDGVDRAGERVGAHGLEALGLGDGGRVVARWRPSRPARPWPAWRSARRRSPSSPARPGGRAPSVGGAVDGQVVLDVGEHPAGLGAGGDGVERQRRRGHARRRWPRPPLRRRRRPPRRARPGGRRAAPAARRRPAATHSSPGSSGHEVGLGEVAVVLGLLLHPERVGAAVVLVPVTGLLAHRLARLDQVDLPASPRSRWPGRATAAS